MNAVRVYTIRPDARIAEAARQLAGVPAFACYPAIRTHLARGRHVDAMAVLHSMTHADKRLVNGSARWCVWALCRATGLMPGPRAELLARVAEITTRLADAG